MTIDKNFIEKYLLSRNGNLNARALEKYAINKELVYQIFNDMPGPAECKECNKPTSFLSFNKGYTEFCSKSCASKNIDSKNKRNQTIQDRFGDAGLKSAEIINKKKTTSLKNYGTEHPLQNDDFKKCLKEKFIKKYGSSPARTSEANTKRQETNLKRYGSTNPLSNENVRKKIKETNIKKYGVTTSLLLPKNRTVALDSRKDPGVYDKLNDTAWLEEHKSTPSTFLSETLGVAFSTILNYYKKYNIQRTPVIVSKNEHKLVEFLQSINVNCLQSDRAILKGKEIDIYLPEYKIGIEINGLYWHSDYFITDKFYHLKKTEAADKAGIHLIHITDYELNNQLEIVKSRLMSKIGKLPRIYARSCEIVDVNYADYASFMKTNHIQGSAAASVRIGLAHNNELVAVMSFSKSRYNKIYEWELIRFASTLTVVGGASKLFSYFLKKYSPSTIISYSDRRWNTGSVYEKIGMTLSHISQPNFWYIVNGKLVHRTSFQKHKLKKNLKEFDPTLSAQENMRNHGYTRFWDCGNKVYTWTKG